VVERLTSVATVLAPTTVLTALLLYYGYIATSARLAYFGIGLSALDLSTQELVLRSTEVVYLPCIVLLGVGLVVQLARTGLRVAVPRPGWRRRLQVIGAVTLVLAVGLLIRGVVGIADPRVAETESIGFTPGAIGLGVALLTTGGYVLLNVTGPPSSGPQRRVGVPVVLLTWGIVAASLFWIMNSFAFAYGQSRAEYDAQTIDRLPRVIVDTKENLYLYSWCVQMEALPEAPEQDFRFRYGELRLLVEGGDRLFLLSTSYDAATGRVRPTPQCPVVVLPQDDSVRLQLRPGAVPAPAPRPDSAG
jgi:hypothetical protein